MVEMTEFWNPLPLPERPLTRDKVTAWFNTEVERIADECRESMLPFVSMDLATGTFNVGWYADWVGFDESANSIDLIAELREGIESHYLFRTRTLDPATAPQIRAAMVNLRDFAASIVDKIDAQVDERPTG